jgi:hypothetical protein
MELLILSVAAGGFYRIGALGFVVVFRNSGVINFPNGGVGHPARLPVLAVRAGDLGAGRESAFGRCARLERRPAALRQLEVGGALAALAAETGT